MVAAIHYVTFDCHDAPGLARFWGQALGWNVYTDDDPEVLVSPVFPPQPGSALLFIPVPEDRTVKNRMHLDLMPTDRSRDEEVVRLVGLGAQIVADHRKPDGQGWVWMADPEGNDFCVERSAAERTSGSQAYRITVPQ
jgi:hypothetical protein